jgi:hypothetical protein
MAMPSSEMNWCGDLQTHPAGQRTGARYPAQASSPLKRCSPRISLAHARKHYILGLVASSKYPYHFPPVQNHVGTSFAVIVQRARRGRACNARDCAQVFVDGAQVTVSHVVIDRPWHDLEKIAIERRWNTVCGYGS